MLRNLIPGLLSLLTLLVSCASGPSYEPLAFSDKVWGPEYVATQIKGWKLGNPKIAPLLPIIEKLDPERKPWKRAAGFHRHVDPDGKLGALYGVAYQATNPYNLYVFDMPRSHKWEAPEMFSKLNEIAAGHQTLVLDGEVLHSRFPVVVDGKTYHIHHVTCNHVRPYQVTTARIPQIDDRKVDLVHLAAAGELGWDTRLSKHLETHATLLSNTGEGRELQRLRTARALGRGPRAGTPSTGAHRFFPEWEAGWKKKNDARDVHSWDQRSDSLERTARRMVADDDARASEEASARLEPRAGTLRMELDARLAEEEANRILADEYNPAKAAYDTAMERAAAALKAKDLKQADIHLAKASTAEENYKKAESRALEWRNRAKILRQRLKDRKLPETSGTPPPKAPGAKSKRRKD